MRMFMAGAILGFVVSWALAQTQSSTLPAAEPTTQPAVPATEAAKPSATQPSAYDAEKMLERMLRAKPGTARPLQPLPDEQEKKKLRRKSEVAPSVPDVPLMREGDVISARVGRLQKGEREGEWELAFESDGRSLKDPPVVLLPNRNLSRMESAVEKSGMDLRFRVTGMVTQYHGRNYLLVEKAEAVPDDF